MLNVSLIEKLLDGYDVFHAKFALFTGSKGNYCCSMYMVSRRGTWEDKRGNVVKGGILGCKGVNINLLSLPKV